ncbi:CHC2 zinc finger domain-containing protein [Kineococcus sp. SYSU DK005]|uniref:CHC2 zinc finger domain-containing protein n=1 Tax=Kineococcus sp. SYSU DK005 TaxID=3383126 RepID=UPI003D7C6749
MPAHLHPEGIHEVERRTALAAVIHARTPLRPGGGDRRTGRCPQHQHQDLDEQLHVRPAAGRWHCFGCGAGGDVVECVVSTQDLSFTQAVQRLAAAAGCSGWHRAALRGG